VTVALSVVRDAMKAVKEEGTKKDASSSRKSGKKDKKVSMEGGAPYDDGGCRLPAASVVHVLNYRESGCCSKPPSVSPCTGGRFRRDPSLETRRRPISF